MYNMSYLKTALNAAKAAIPTAKTAIPAVGVPASMLEALLKGGKNTASNLSQGGSINGLTYSSPTYKPEYGSTVATQETPLPQSAPQPYVPPAPAPEPAPTSNFNGSSQYSDEEIVNLFNEISGSLNKGNVYNQQLGGSAIDQLSRLQAQKANEKAGRTGLYEIDPNMAFSPDQIRQQRNAADAFYDEQLGKYASAARMESANSSKDSNEYGGYNNRQNKAIDEINYTVSNNPAFKKLVSMRNYANNIDAALSQNNGLGDVAAINQFQKIIDEGAVTRDQDVKLIQSAQSLLNLLETKIEGLKKGDKLSTDQRSQMRALMKQYLDNQAKDVSNDPGIGSQVSKASRYNIELGETSLGDLLNYESSVNTNNPTTNDPYAQQYGAYYGW